MRSRPISARVRILAAVLAVACVGLAIVGSVTFVVQHESVLAAVDERLKAQVDQIDMIAAGAQAAEDAASPQSDSSTVREAIAIEEFADVEEFLHAAVTRLVPGRNEDAVALIDGVAPFPPDAPRELDIAHNQALIDAALAATADGGVSFGTTATDQGTLSYVAIPVTVAGDPRQGLYVRAVDVEAELSLVTAAMITYAIAAVAVLLAIGIVGYFVMGRLLSPIRRLRDTASAITLSDLSPRMPEQGNDDIADLSRTVNSMLDRIEGSVDVQRQLLDDVRHELKTPITIVRGHLELMDPSDLDDVTAAKQISIAELDRMTRLVEDIDMLASVEGGSFTMRDVDIAALTARVAELVSVIPGHEWIVGSGATGRARGDHDRLLQAWLQLADNAAKYTPPGSTIEIGSAADASGVRLWVCDHGPGIPPALRHRIFRRFDRAHGKRAVGGSGLGLAIVDAIAKAHGGQCVVTDTRGGGATFTILLPAATADLPAPVRAGDVVLQREATG